MALTPVQAAELTGRMIDYAIENGTSQQITAIKDALLWAAKDYIPNGTGGFGGPDEADRQEAMASLRDLAFEADTGLDATIDAHEKTFHWLPAAEDA